MTQSRPTSLRVTDLLDELQGKHAAKFGIAAAVAWRAGITFICIEDGRVNCIEGADNEWVISWLNVRLSLEKQASGFLAKAS